MCEIHHGKHVVVHLLVFSIVHLAFNMCLSIKAEIRRFFESDTIEQWEQKDFPVDLGSYPAAFTNDDMDYIFTSSSGSLLACSVGVCCFGDDERGGATQMKRKPVQSLFVLLHM